MSERVEWTGLLVDQKVIATAKYKVERASNGEYSAGLELIGDCALALRDIVTKGNLPDAERQLYLKALLESLEKIVDGVEPARAMYLEKSHGRPADPQKLARDLSVFLLVGKEYERLTKRGLTKSDKPIAEALTLATKSFGLSLAATQKIWSDFGSLEGWARFNSD
jgi:hypothetical protein